MTFPAERSGGRPRTIAFYLPQFHAIPENDSWWGAGFTEWANVRRAQPQFHGHAQPKRAGLLGEYDLSDVAVLGQQATLAKQSGIDAFCFYHYWFSGKRLLEQPVNDFLMSDIDMPFCLAWANESWSRRWDGKDRELLIAQGYERGSATASFMSLAPYLADKRYLRVNGAAPILVHRVDQLPAPENFADVWRKLAREMGIGPLNLVASETVHGLDPRLFGFDAVVEFPPVGANGLIAVSLNPPRGINRHFRGRLMSYDRISDHYRRRPEPPFTRYSGVMPAWDNTARRGSRATIYVGSTPEAYRKWLRAAREREVRIRGAAGMVFINAWNEWAEGAYLEPDATSGKAYLSASRWNASEVSTPRERACGRGWPSLPYFFSLSYAVASSAVGAKRRVVAQIRRKLAALGRLTD